MVCLQFQHSYGTSPKLIRLPTYVFVIIIMTFVSCSLLHLLPCTVPGVVTIGLVRVMDRWHKRTLNKALIYYPAICSMGGNQSCLWLFSFFTYGNGFLSRGFTDQCETLHGSLATSRTGLLPFLRGIFPGMASFWHQLGPYGGICFLLKHLLCLV